MNNLINQKVKIFFKNNTIAEGIVQVYSEKRMVLSSENDLGYLIIFEPQANILMIRVFKEEIKQDIDLPAKNPRQKTGFDRFFDKEMENPDFKEGYQKAREELKRANKSFVPNQMPVNEILQRMGMGMKPEVFEQVEDSELEEVVSVLDESKKELADYLVKEIRESDLRYKKLAELKQLQIQAEREAIKNKLTTFEPSSYKVNYGYPTKLGTLQHSTKEDIRSLRTNLNRLSNLQR